MRRRTARAASRLLRSLVAVVLAALVTIAFVVAAIFVATAMGRVLG